MNKGLAMGFCCVFVGAVLAGAQACAACSVPPGTWKASPDAATRPQVLVVGDYHMANPDLDIADSHAGNVLSPKRQAQIEQVVAVLARFKPTKVAVEREPQDDSALASNYRKYVAGKHALERNEIQQIGFRLAKNLGLKTVCGVDASVGLNVGLTRQYAKAEGLSREYDAQIDEIKREAKTGTAYLHTHTVLQYLVRLNSDSWVSRNVGFYYRQAHFSWPNWGGADVLSLWFKRNMRIYANIVSLIGSPHARILVLIGAGHVGWLRHDFASDPTIRLRKLSAFMK